MFVHPTVNERYVFLIYLIREMKHDGKGELIIKKSCLLLLPLSSGPIFVGMSCWYGDGKQGTDHSRGGLCCHWGGKSIS